jgi:hypothetical protein
MDRAVAQRVLASVIQSNGALNDAIGVLRETAETPDVREAMRRIATLIMLIGTGIYHPIYFEHPDLCPEGLRFMTEKPPQPRDWPWGETGA